MHGLKNKGQGLVTSLDGTNSRSIQTLTDREGVITTRSNRMKFRLRIGIIAKKFKMMRTLFFSDVFMDIAVDRS